MIADEAKAEKNHWENKDNKLIMINLLRRFKTLMRKNATPSKQKMSNKMKSVIKIIKKA